MLRVTSTIIRSKCLEYTSTTVFPTKVLGWSELFRSNRPENILSSSDAASGRVDALKAGDGTVQWQVDTIYPVDAIAIDGRTLYVATNSPGHAPEGRLWALDTFDGEERWRRYSEQHNYSWIGVVDETLYVRTYGDSGDRTLFRAIETADGAEQWTYKFDERSLNGAAVVNGTAYVGEPHTVSALQ